MTSCGPNSQPLNFTYLFKNRQIVRDIPRTSYTKGSIMDILNTHPDFTKFTYIIKLAEMDNILDNIQANFTIFVPSDTELKYEYIDNRIATMDTGDAREIVLASLIDERIPKELITDSPAAYFITKNKVNRMFITNINNISKINNDITILQFDIIAMNGIIHVVNKLIDPLKM